MRVVFVPQKRKKARASTQDDRTGINCTKGNKGNKGNKGKSGSHIFPSSRRMRHFA